MTNLKANIKSSKAIRTSHKRNPFGKVNSMVKHYIKYHTLNASQKTAYNKVFTETASNNKVHKLFITAGPGFGKTYLAGVIADGARMRSTGFYTINAVAPSHKAKSVLAQSIGDSVQTNTIHRHCGYVLKEGDPAIVNDNGELMKAGSSMDCDMLIVDEVSMIPDGLFQDAISTARDIIVVMGDIDQLKVVSGSQANLGNFTKVELTEQMRQKDTEMALYKNIMNLRNQVRGAHAERFVYDNSFMESKHGLVQDFIDGKIDVIAAWENKVVDTYNARIQKELTGDFLPVAGNTMITQSPFMQMQTVNGKEVKKIVVNNGEPIVMQKVEKADTETHDKILKAYGVYTLKVSFETLTDEPYSAILLYGEKKNDTWNIFKKFFQGKVTWKVFSANTIKAKLPYAMTVHKMQGSSYNAVGIDRDNLWKCTKDRARLAYVAVSRARELVMVA